MPNQKEIDAVLNLCYDQIDHGWTRYHAMTYEEGVECAIRWMQEEIDEVPMEKE